MRLFLAGCGVVGQALLQLCLERAAELARTRGFVPQFVGVADARGAALAERGIPPADVLHAKRARRSVGELPFVGRGAMPLPQALARSGADALILATPTNVADARAAVELVLAALRARQHVISVNKAPFATAYAALTELARHNQRELRCSGTVGAGTPMLALLRECARGDEILAVEAILNGTTNYILWRMQTAGASFSDALAEAQKLGYAEADPSADVDGVDTATKLVILANAALGRPATLADVRVLGIREVTAADHAQAAARGQVLRLLGSIDAAGALRVAPTGVERGGPLDVTGSTNALRASLRAAGDIVLRGRGAGGPETATALLRDLLDVWDVMEHA